MCARIAHTQPLFKDWMKAFIAPSELIKFFQISVQIKPPDNLLFDFFKIVLGNVFVIENGDLNFWSLGFAFIFNFEAKWPFTDSDSLPILARFPIVKFIGVG